MVATPLLNDGLDKTQNESQSGMVFQRGRFGHESKPNHIDLIFRSWSPWSAAILFLLMKMYCISYHVGSYIYIFLYYLLFFPNRQVTSPLLETDHFDPPPLDLALPTWDRYDALQSHGPHGETGEFLGKRHQFLLRKQDRLFFWRENDVENFRSVKTIESKGFWNQQKVYTKDASNLMIVSFDNKSPHPPNWWSNNLLSMVPCVVLCHWWWLEPRSNVAVPPLRPRWHISDSAAIFMTFPDDSGWEQEVMNKIHRLVKISGDCFFLAGEKNTPDSTLECWNFSQHICFRRTLVLVSNLWTPYPSPMMKLALFGWSSDVFASSHYN